MGAILKEQRQRIDKASVLILVAPGAAPPAPGYRPCHSPGELESLIWPLLEPRLYP